MPAAAPEPAPPLILYDGDCGMCHGAVKFILRHERAPTLHFAALSGDRARAALAAHGLAAPPPDTMIVVTPERMMVRSDAVLFITTHLRAPWRWGAIFRHLPRPWRDAAYHAIATRRHRLFARPDSPCPLLTAEQRRRFH